MKVIMTSRNYNPSDKLKDTAEKKFEKLGKYFSENIVVNVMVGAEKGNQYKLEATINAGGTIFRAEERGQDPYTCLDKAVDKLSTQMSRFKTKLLRRHKDQKMIIMEDIPDFPEHEEEAELVKTKRFDVAPMSVEEAILQMELLEHNFFLFLNMETDRIGVVYKRKDGDYGLLEPKY